MNSITGIFLLALLIQLSSVYTFSNRLKNSPSIRNYIVGGESAEAGQFPFQVGINLLRFLESVGHYNAWCGGSLISDQVVLTAAHCLQGTISAEVYLGATDLVKREPQQIVVNVQEAAFIVHENFDPGNFDNDIALIILPEKIRLTDHIQVVNLPRKSQKNQTFEKAIGWISGWGSLGEGLGAAEVLQYTRRWILPNEHCKDYYENFNEAHQVCVDGSHSISACQGDSGGPLTVEEDDGSRLLVGVTSYGRPEGCEMGFPVAYTRVTAYFDWIAEKGGVNIRE